MKHGETGREREGGERGERGGRGGRERGRERDFGERETKKSDVEGTKVMCACM